MPSETVLQASIIRALSRLGWWVWRVNAGARGGVRMAPSGTPDICVVAPVEGWLEVKLPGGNLRPAQELWHARAHRMGVRVAVVTSVAQAVNVVTAWRDEKEKARGRQTPGPEGE
jgi:hypothetical protein